MARRSATSRAPGRLPAALLSLLVLTVGCATGTPSSTSAWQGATDRTLGTVLSDLGTARLAVAEDTRNHVPHTYAVVAATDAIESSSKEISSYLTSQPPDQLHAAHATVAMALQQASALLVEVRVELASPGLDGPAARKLLDRIDAMRYRIDKLDSEVKKSPASVGRS